MTELYEWPPTRSQRAKWALEELEVPYTSRKIVLLEQEQDSAAYRAIHPLGVVPALRTEAYTIYEVIGWRHWHGRNLLVRMLHLLSGLGLRWFRQFCCLTGCLQPACGLRQRQCRLRRHEC